MTYLFCFALIWIAPIYERAKKLENISIHYAIPSNNINALCGAVAIQLIDNRLLCVDFKLKVMVMFTSKLYLGIKIDRIQSMEDIFGICNWKWQRNKMMWQIVKSNGHIFIYWNPQSFTLQTLNPSDYWMENRGSSGISRTDLKSWYVGSIPALKNTLN